jgi:hypothetical protein
MSQIGERTVDRRKPIDWSTDEAGMIVGVRAHDGFIRSVSISTTAISLVVERQDASRAELVFGGVSKFGMRLQNGAILADLFAWKLGDIASPSLPQLYSPKLALFASSLPPEEAEISFTKLAKQFPDRTLAYVSCSYGGELAAICESLEAFALPQ